MAERGDDVRFVPLTDQVHRSRKQLGGRSPLCRRGRPPAPIGNPRAPAILRYACYSFMAVAEVARVGLTCGRGSRAGNEPLAR
jgi:hypothetical protein